MMLLGMSSKRQRRPNVRLGEIGDVSAALRAVNSIRPRQNLEEKRCNNYELEKPREIDFNPVDEESLRISEFTMNGLVDNMQNLENWNPNSSKSVFEFTELDENDTSKSKLDYGIIAPRGRVMKRRGRSIRGKNRVAGKAWSSRVNSEIGDKSENGYLGTAFIRQKNDEFHDENEFHDDDEFQDDQLVDELERSSDHDTSNPCKDVYEGEWTKSALDWQMGCESDYDELLMRDESKEDDVSNSGEDPCAGPGSSGAAEDMGFSGSTVNSVSAWLEEMGFRKYVGLFQMHEVDNEVLPELTVEDLKDMGINAVGTRRKLYTAIQLLKD